MNFYVHYEFEPEMTIACRWSDSHKGSVGDVLKLFLDAYNKRYPSHALNSSSVQLVDESRQFLDLSLLVTDAIEDRADIYVLTNLSGQPSHAVTATASTAANGVEDQAATAKHSLLDILKSAQLTGGFEVLPTAVRSVDGQTDGEVDRLINKLTGKEADMSDREEDRLVIAGAIQLAHKYLSDENAKEAAVVYKCILEVHPRHKTACVELAKVYEKAGRYKDAVKYLRQASASDSSDGDLLQQLGDDLLESGETQEAVQVFLQCADRLSSAGPDKIDAIKVRIARAQRMEGKDSAALAMLSDVLQRKKENMDGLLEYARIAHKKGPAQAKEAMAICTCLMAPKQSDKKFHLFLAEMIEQHGLDLLYREMKTAANSPPALGYISAQLRDFGAVNEAAAMMERALDIQPSHTSCALAYVHTLHVLMRCDDAYEYIREFSEKNKELSVSEIKCGWFLPLIPKMDRVYMSAVVANEGKVPDEFSSGSSTSGGPYTAEQLDLVAIYFTLVKILYFNGALKLIRPLCDIIDVAQSGRDLHTTVIRNEYAYFSCISQVMKVPGIHMPQEEEDMPPFIFFAGESHAISPAWRSISYQGQPHVIHPVLATGLKLWHLRKESKFYPKIAFYNAIKKVPRESTVIFCFGEIDCREGLTRAVKRCKYETLEEAAMAVINVYVTALKELRTKYKFKVFVHPVVPVLSISRKVVALFNEMLKERLGKTKHLKYLDFSSSLVTEDGSKFKPEYELDGTHVHPSYLSLIEDALKG